jgi:GAF domain-containing protein/HAMP domain-containing protein/anti-sigma regulatory factor (Ser/Thr protein kinase)
MLFRSSLRAKTLLYVLIPTVLGLLAVATIALYAYERVAQDVVQQRDAEFASLQAARLAEGLHQYTELLQDYALQRDIQSMDVNRLIEAMATPPEEFGRFDAGVVVFDQKGVALWATRPFPRRRGTDYPLPAQFDQVRLTLQPSLSDVFTDSLTGEAMISLAVPVTDANGKFRGVLAGLQTLRSSTFPEAYAKLLQISPGQSRQTYIVDGNGRVVYYEDTSRLGASLSNWAPVAQAISRESGALLVEDETGDAVISGFAPVPDMSWALVTQQRWDDIVRPIRRYSNLLIGVLIIAGLSSGVLVFLSIGRALRPIRDLTQGAQRIAGGDFDYTITTKSGDEVQALGQQFNLMAEALRSSYQDLERRVADRTKELAALNSIAEVVSSTLDLQEVLDDALDKTLEVMAVEAGGIYLVKQGESAPGEGLLTIASYKGVDPDFVAAINNLRVGEGFSGRVVQTGEPLVVPDLSSDPRLTRSAVTESGFRSVAIVPLASRIRIWGSLFAMTRTAKRFSEQDVDLLSHIADQIAVAIENATLFETQQRRAEQFRVLSEIGAHITSLLEVDELLRETVRLVNQVLGYYLVAIGLIEGDELVVKAGTGPRWSDPEFHPPRLPLGAGISGWVAQTGEPLLAPDVSRHPRFLRLADSTETRSELAVPLMVKSRVIGVLDVQSDQLNAFDESDLIVLQSLANLTAIALEEARLFDAEQRRAEQFRVISEVGASITSILTVDELLQQIVRLVKTSLGYYHTAIGLVDGDELVMKAGVGAHWDHPGFEPSRLQVGREGITAWVAASGEPLLVPNVTKDSRYLPIPGSEEIRSEVAVPLKTTSGVIGVLDVQSDQTNGLDQSDLAVLKSVAHQAAIAIENARLYEQAQQAAALEERSRLARDLHDAVTQTLFSASLIGEVVPTVWESDETEGRKLLEELRHLTRGALAEMRTLLLELRPAALVESSLDELLRQLSEAASGRSGLAIQVVIEGEEGELPPEVHVALYRIAQEALNNVVKHARATAAQVRLRCTASAEGVEAHGASVVELAVTDNGSGFDPDQVSPDRLGLGIIRERAEAIGATLRIQSERGVGTEIFVLWPGEP